MNTVQTDLIALTTSLNLMRGSKDFDSVHNDFVVALGLAEAMNRKEEAEAFAEVLRRRNLIKTA